MLISDHIRQTIRRLEKAGVDSPGLSGRLLVCHATGLDKIALLLAGNTEIDEAASARLDRLVERRAQGEPLAYILGKREFYGLEFFVDNSTLVPRPETELLVDLALELFPAGQATFADIGCGSGCIGIALLTQRPGWKGLLIDFSARALAVTAKNATKNALKCAIVQADIFALPLARNSLDLCISNPPYIAYAEKPLVMPECLAFEPHSALFSPNNGLGHLEAVINGASVCLKPGGWIIVEHGMAQAEPVKELLQGAGFASVNCRRDLAGLNRCTFGQKG